ncbi:MAG: response regulator [Oscillospiraceae bacterium]|nr:response regulator [Oscillospiraceae bacterium]
MKYKILISCENASILKDFFLYSDTYFKCLTTSELWKDISGHFDVFEPDVYLVFPESSYSDTLSQIGRLKATEAYRDTPVVICAKEDICAEIESQFTWGADLIIKRPISPDNLSLSIINFLEKKAEEEAKNNEQATASDGAPEKDTADTANSADPAKRLHILIVDDDRTVLKLLKSTLEEKYDVTAMLNGVLVEKALASKPADLIILDYEMPIMTGAEVYRKIKENPATKNTPVCFLTGVSERSKVEEIMSLRPRGYLLKPISTDMLFAAVSNLTQT